MRILVCDSLAESALERLREAGLDVTVRTGMSPEELAGELGKGYDAAVVRSATKLRRPALEAARGLKLIVRAGVGLDNIDVACAQEREIEVRNTPRASSNSVAELALAHMFALARFLPQATQSMREGKWEKKAFKGIELSGKTLGIVGIGRIGQSLAQRALALGMKVVAADKYVHASPMEDVELVRFDDLLNVSDFVSIHVPVDPEGPVIGVRELASMKQGAFLINCARGGVVDEKALLDALDSGHLAGAGLDVFETEPPQDMALLGHAKLSLTPHIGAQTAEAQARVGDEVVDILIEKARGA